MASFPNNDQNGNDDQQNTIGIKNKNQKFGKNICKSSGRQIENQQEVAHQAQYIGIRRQSNYFSDEITREMALQYLFKLWKPRKL